MSNVRSYSAAHAIFRIFETLGWIVVALGALLAVIGLASGNFPMFPQIGDLTFSDRLIAMIPGILFAEAGLIQIVLVKVGQANVDTAGMTREMLRIMKHGKQSASNGRAPALQPTPKLTPRASAPTSRVPSAQPREQVLVETYKGVRIYQRDNGYYVGVGRYSNLGAAKTKIDSISSEPILELTPDTSATKEAEDTLVEIYKGVEIHQRDKQYRGHTIGDQYFLDLEAARRHIDSLTSDEEQD